MSNLATGQTFEVSYNKQTHRIHYTESTEEIAVRLVDLSTQTDENPDGETGEPIVTFSKSTHYTDGNLVTFRVLPVA